jgi:SAM-dependent methyltransferase
MNRWRLELRYLLGNAPWDSGISPPELEAFLGAHTAGRAVDIGCGTGTNLASLAGRGWDATGIDLAQIAVWKARAKLARAGLSAQVLRGDVTRPMPFAKPFDMALDLGCSHALRGRRRLGYAENVRRWLRPGGTLLVYTFYRPEGESSRRWLALDEVLSTFEPGFAIHNIEKGDFRGRVSAWLTLERLAA